MHTAHFVIVVLPRSPAQETGSRLGITVTKRIARRAVDRNRIKRVVREVFRRNRDRLPAACDLVFVAKPDAEQLGYDAVLAEVTRAERALQAAARAARRRAGAEASP